MKPHTVKEMHNRRQGRREDGSYFIEQGRTAPSTSGIVRLSLGPETNFLFIPIIGPLSHPPTTVTAPTSAVNRTDGK